MIFVTGGTGLIGSHLLYELVSGGHKVKALRRQSSNLQQVLNTFSYYSSNPDSLFQQIEWVEGDITDYFGLEKLLQNVSEVYNCAGMISFHRSVRKQMHHVNVDGTASLVNAALENGIEKFCHVSSVASLGRLQNGQPVTEETHWMPSKKISGYSESKFLGETEVWRAMEEGLDAVVVNPSIVLGPGNWNVGSSRMFTTIHKGMKFYTGGVTGFVDVRDVVKAMVMLMDDRWFDRCKNQRFLLSAENISYRQIFNSIADALGKPRPKNHASDLMLSAAWRLASVASAITGKPAAITRETVAGSNRITNFDGSKISRLTGFTYREIADSIEHTARHMKKDFGN